VKYSPILPLGPHLFLFYAFPKYTPEVISPFPLSAGLAPSLRACPTRISFLLSSSSTAAFFVQPHRSDVEIQLRAPVSPAAPFPQKARLSRRSSKLFPKSKSDNFMRPFLCRRLQLSPCNHKFLHLLSVFGHPSIPTIYPLPIFPHDGAIIGHDP